MSTMRKEDRVEAICVADLHLSHTPPIARSGEKDWYKAMRGTLEELYYLQAIHGAPVLCAGDVFHKWNSPPELINFALRYLPPLYAVPGQHDLPHHRYDDIKKSAYWTLVEAGKIVNLDPDNEPIGIGALCIQGVPYGCEWIKMDPSPKSSLVRDVILIHSYVWTKDTGYHGAPADKRLGVYKERLKGFDLAVFGDNHVPFCRQLGDCTVLNCGSLMRRNSDQRDYRPKIWLYHASGDVSGVDLDVSRDVLGGSPSPGEGKEDPNVEVTELLEVFKELRGSQLSFRDALKRYMDSNDVRQDVKDVLLTALDVIKE